jgi:hypothetical protein
VGSGGARPRVAGFLPGAHAAAARRLVIIDRRFTAVGHGYQRVLGAGRTRGCLAA